MSEFSVLNPPSVLRAGQESHRALLVALRSHLAATIDAGPSGRDLNTLAKRLLDVSAELEELDVAEGDPVAEAAGTPDEPWAG